MSQTMFPKRGPSPIVGSEKLRPGLDALIPGLDPKDYPVNMPEVAAKRARFDAPASAEQIVGRSEIKPVREVKE